MLREQREHAVGDPAAMAELDAEADVARQGGQQLRQRRQLDRSEVRSELDEDGTELLTQLTSAVVEQVRDVVGVAESPLVGDLLRQLEREGEAVRRTIIPATHG